jgi:radical SAM superfamily enzyme YgiQ (UPF0313 family)
LDNRRIGLTLIPKADLIFGDLAIYSIPAFALLGQTNSSVPMKLVLIQPPIRDFYQSRERLQPLGLAYLKAAVRKEFPHLEVVIKDFHQGRGKQDLPLPEELAYLRDYYPFADRSPFSLFHRFRHFGASFETAARETAAEKPDLVGISSLFTPYYREVLKTAEAIKEKWPCPIVIGGPQVTALPEVILAHPAVDWVIRGEGEKALVELIRALEQGTGWSRVPGLGYKAGSRLFFNPPPDPLPLEALPWPDLSDLDPQAYRMKGRPLCFILTSRGCPHHCSFCSIRNHFPGYRRRDPDEVFREIRHRFQEGFRVFDFEDDNLTYRRRPFLRLCRLLSDHFSPGEIELTAMNGLSYESLDAELLFWMKKAGFTGLNLSLVSADPKVRRGHQRPFTLEKYVEVVREALRLGLRVISYQILGLPGESLDSMIETLRMNAGLPVLLGASPYYLNPGSPLAESHPPLTPADLVRCRLTAMAVETEDCKREDLYTLWLASRIINFFKGIPLEKDETDLQEALELAERRGGRSALGVEIFKRLKEEGILYGASPEGFRPLTKFRPKVFEKIWSGLDRISTTTGKTILL